ncbi:hypothetical protein B0T14DRAFT_491904 [Immersiella caudata]|uniref:Transmembrane protein n=1 Tax=Immersiella caudata TaxID=314043 RepID=A0AA39XI75_9PEZI|nr:hypothetical protein B0T14DRAFT_491904 [Immersiella caudata]
MSAAVTPITVIPTRPLLKLATICEAFLLISTIALSLLGCTTDSPGIPNIYNLELELEPCDTKIRVGYFVEVDNIYKGEFQGLLEDPNYKRPKDNCSVKDVLQAALDFQFRYFQALEAGALALLLPTIIFGLLWASKKTARVEHKKAIVKANADANKAHETEGREGPAPPAQKATRHTSKKLWRAFFVVSLFFSATLSGAASLSVWQATNALQYASSSPLFQGKVPIRVGYTLIWLQGLAVAFASLLFVIVIWFQIKEKEDQAYAWVITNKPAPEKPAPATPKANADTAANTAANTATNTAAMADGNKAGAPVAGGAPGKNTTTAAGHGGNGGGPLAHFNFNIGSKGE